MELTDIRAAWLNDALIEEDVPETALPRALQGKGLHLVVRELSADEAGDIIDTCTDKSGHLNQKKFMAMVVVNSLRNGDDPACPLIWDMTFMQPLLSKSLKPILQIATQSIQLSGLNDQLTTELKNDSGATVVEGSLSV